LQLAALPVASFSPMLPAGHDRLPGSNLDGYEVDAVARAGLGRGSGGAAWAGQRTAACCWLPSVAARYQRAFRSLRNAAPLP
jgi:hypothetical protein